MTSVNRLKIRCASFAPLIFSSPSAGRRGPVCTENSNPEVMMVKPAQDGVRTYETGSLNRPRIRRIFV